MLRSLLLFAALAAAPTCNIPVFRYALERWPAGPYEVVALHRGPLTEEEIAALSVLRQSGANLEVDHLDLDLPLPPKRKLLLDRLRPEVPGLIALYPGTQDEAWRGPLTAEAARGLADSPVRREVARRILEGQSGVWILLESGDPAKDDAAASLLAGELGTLERSLKLPPHHPDDPPLLSELPVKVSFSVLRLPRTEPTEQPLVSMLLRSESGLSGTLAFPVFGRGRSLWPMAGAGLNRQYIGDAGVFLTGACSCEAKELNPGFDLLFAADWEAGLAAGPETPRAPEPLLKPRPPEAGEPVRAPGSSSVLWIALLIAGFLVALSGRRILAAGKGDRR